MRVERLGLERNALRQRYDDLFESCPDAFIQQSTWWAEVIKDIGPDEPIFLLAEDGGVDVAGLPLYLFRSDAGNIITSVPQAGPLGGVFLRPGLDRDTAARAYAALLGRARELAEEHSCISITLITNPFADDTALYDAALEPTFTLENFTQWIAIDEVIANGAIVLPAYTKRHRVSRNVKKGREAGFTTSFVSSAAELEAWYAIHSQRHRELGATPLPFALFTGMYDLLKPRGKSDLLLVKAGDEIASGAFYIMHRNVMDVFMLSMNSKWMESAPNFINTEQSLLWAASRGVKIYNWQGSPNRTSGVYTYKKEWGSHDSPYRFVTRLLQPLEQVVALGPSRLRESFPWHYVVPFSGFEDGFAAKHYRKGEPAAAAAPAETAAAATA